MREKEAKGSKLVIRCRRDKMKKEIRWKSWLKREGEGEGVRKKRETETDRESDGELEREKERERDTE